MDQLDREDRTRILGALRTLAGAYAAGTNVEPADVARVGQLARTLRGYTDADRGLVAAALFTQREHARMHGRAETNLTRLLGVFGWRD